jgi:hypothetical protein
MPQTMLAGVHPDVKALIEKVIVPILVREYLEMLRAEKQVDTLKQSVTPYSFENATVPGKVGG